VSSYQKESSIEQKNQFAGGQTAQLLTGEGRVGSYPADAGFSDLTGCALGTTG
jgi:hypothetical protein